MVVEPVRPGAVPGRDGRRATSIGTRDRAPTSGSTTRLDREPDRQLAAPTRGPRSARRARLLAGGGRSPRGWCAAEGRRPRRRAARFHRLRRAERARELRGAMADSSPGGVRRRGLSQDRDGEQRPSRGGGARLLDRYWRAANYLSVGQIYLLDTPRRLEDIYRPRTAIAACRRRRRSRRRVRSSPRADRRTAGCRCERVPHDRDVSTRTEGDTMKRF